MILVSAERADRVSAKDEWTLKVPSVSPLTSGVLASIDERADAGGPSSIAAEAWRASVWWRAQGIGG